MSAKIGVSADDITGSNDIGIMFTKAGLTADIYSGQAECCDADVVIIDTDSRFDDPKTAYEKVYNATKQLMTMGVQRFYKKTCSVFRGNIGAEFDAMLDALGESFAVVVLGFPDNGRKTVHSIHYVNNTRLEETHFRNDPMNPMRVSNLVDILSSQTKGKVKAIWTEELDKGEAYLKERLKVLEKEARFVIFDVRDNADLELIAKVVHNRKVICGSSAIAAHTGKYFRSSGSIEIQPDAVPDAGKGKLIAAGSLTPQTIEQINYMRRLGVKTLELDTLKVFDAGESDKMRRKLIDEACDEIVKGRNVIVHTANDSQVVKKTKDIARQAGMEDSVLSKLISGQMADVASEIILRTGQRRVIVMGGDTSAVFCERMKINGQRVWKEIQPGLPSCITLNDNPLWVVLKSGSFGTSDFLMHALDHLNRKE